MNFYERIHQEDGVIDIMPAVIAKKWRSLSLKIRGRVANVVASDAGKIQLRLGTRDRLCMEICMFCRELADQKHILEQVNPELYKLTLRMFLIHSRSHWNRSAETRDRVLSTLLSISSSPTERIYIESLLNTVGVPAQTLQRIYTGKTTLSL